jgi:hypothetical protein
VRKCSIVLWKYLSTYQLCATAKLWNTISTVSSSKNPKHYKQFNVDRNILSNRIFRIEIIVLLERWRKNFLQSWTSKPKSSALIFSCAGCWVFNTGISHHSANNLYNSIWLLSDHVDATTSPIQTMIHLMHLAVHFGYFRGKSYNSPNISSTFIYIKSLSSLMKDASIDVFTVGVAPAF